MGTYYGTPETARLMFDAGSGNPFYIWSCDYSGVTWSASYPSLAAQCGYQFTCDAGVTSQFKNKFGYSSANFGNYYFSTVKSNLDAGQPVILTAHRDENCFLGACWPIYSSHMWVCDGYQKTDYFYCSCGCGGSSIMLHMNWGWENVNTAWVSENNWAVNVNLNNDGGGVKNWNYFTAMYSNIRP